MISLLALEKIAKKSGVARISRPALEELQEITEEEAEKMAKKAVLLCNHAQRNTVLGRDIDLASR